MSMLTLAPTSYAWCSTLHDTPCLLPNTCRHLAFLPLNSSASGKYTNDHLIPATIVIVLRQPAIQAQSKQIPDNTYWPDFKMGVAMLFKWNDSSRICKDIKSFNKTGEKPVMKKFHAHSDLLVVHSSYFQAMFSSIWTHNGKHIWYWRSWTFNPLIFECHSITW